MIRAPSLFGILLCLKCNAYELYMMMTDCILNPLYIKAYKCPHCGKKGTLVCHGSYKRNFYYYDTNTNTVVNGHGGKGIIVQRFICLYCCHTHAFLPDVIVPWSSYSLIFILQAIYEVEVCKNRVTDVCDKYDISERTLRKWRKKLTEETTRYQVSSVRNFLHQLETYNTTKALTDKIYGYNGIAVTGFSSFCRSWYEQYGSSFMQLKHLDEERRDVRLVRRCAKYLNLDYAKVTKNHPSYVSVKSFSTATDSQPVPFQEPKAYPWCPPFLAEAFYDNGHTFQTPGNYPWQQSASAAASP